MAEQIVDLRSSAGLLRQKRRLLARIGAVGLVLGLAYAILVPTRLGSSTLVLLPTPAGGQQGAGNSEVDTQVLMVLSTTVLERAGQEMSPAMSAEDVKGHIEVSARTPQLIEIRAVSSSAGQARAISQTVAETFIASIRDTARQITSATVSDLRERSDTLEAQLTTLQAEVDAASVRQRAAPPSSPDGRREAQLLAQLRAEQANTSLQLDKVKGDIFNFSTLGSAARAGISIVQAASPATGPRLVRRASTFAPLGFLITGLSAAVALLVQARRDPRVRTREDLADAVASTVLADVRSSPQRSVAEWSALLETNEVGPVEAWAFRQVLRAVVPIESRGSVRKENPGHSGRLVHPRSLSVLSLSGDERALTIAPRLAVFASSMGIRTRLVVAGNRDGMAPLWAACANWGDYGLRSGLVVGDSTRTRSIDTKAKDVGAANELGAESRRNAQEPVGRSNGRTTSFDEEIAKRIAAFFRKWPGPAGSSPVPQPRRESEPPIAETVTTPPPDSSTESESESEPHRIEPAVDLTIVVIAADGTAPSLSGVQETEATLLAIAPGAATTAELAKLAVAVDDSGRRIDGIVVADPDAWDNTTGRRALDERARQAQLPIRMAGSDSVAGRVP